jgi:hypothetical protein
VLFHSVCIQCFPNMDGPARCGTLPDVHMQGGEIGCLVCIDLDGVPCETCQPSLFALWLAMNLDE